MRASGALDNGPRVTIVPHPASSSITSALIMSFCSAKAAQTKAITSTPRTRHRPQDLRLQHPWFEQDHMYIRRMRQRTCSYCRFAPSSLPFSLIRSPCTVKASNYDNNIILSRSQGPRDLQLLLLRFDQEQVIIRRMSQRTSSGCRSASSSISSAFIMSPCSVKEPDYNNNIDQPLQGARTSGTSAASPQEHRLQHQRCGPDHVIISA